MTPKFTSSEYFKATANEAIWYFRLGVPNDPESKGVRQGVEALQDWIESINNNSISQDDYVRILEKLHHEDIFIGSIWMHMMINLVHWGKIQSLEIPSFVDVQAVRVGELWYQYDLGEPD